MPNAQLFGRVTFRDACDRAIAGAALPFVKKFRLRLAMAFRPGVRNAVHEYLLEKINADHGMGIESVDAQINLDNLERLLQLLIQYLPEIIKLIEMIIGLFGEEAAAAEA